MLHRRHHVKHKLQKIKPKKSIFKMLWFWILILCLIILASITYFFIFFDGFQLKNVNVSGNTKLSTQDLQNLITKESTTELINTLGIKVSSKSIFLIDKNKISKNLLNKIPEIENLTVNKEFPQTLTVKILERKPIGAFCPTPQADSSCFLIDQNGVIFEQFSAFSADVTIVRQYFGDNQLSLGKKVVAQNIISAIYEVQKILRDNFKINLTEALITSPLRLDVITSQNWKGYFDLSPSSDINSQLKKLNTLLAGGLTPESISNLKYIDLRPKDRAIVCDNSVCGQ